MWNNPQGYGSTGYQSNPAIQLQDFVMKVTRDELDSYVRAGRCDANVANEVFNRIRNHLPDICSDLMRMFGNNGQGTIDGNAIYRFLAENDIPQTTQRVNSERYGYNPNQGGYNQSYGYSSNGGFFGGNNQPVISQPVYSNNQGYVGNGGYYNNGPQVVFGNTPLDTGRVVSESGLARAFQKNMRPTQQQVTQSNRPVNKSNVLNTSNFRYNQQVTQDNANATTMTYDEAMQKQTESMRYALGGIHTPTPNYKEIIDEATGGSSMRVDVEKTNESKVDIGKISRIERHEIFRAYMRNLLGANQVVTIEKTATAFEPSAVSAITNTVIKAKESTDLCDSSEISTTTSRGTVLNTSDHVVNIPVVDTREAIDLVKIASPDAMDQENWITSIEYNELVAKKIPNGGADARGAVRTLQKNVCKVQTLTDISNFIIPVVTKQNSNIKAYLETLIFKRINELLKLTAYVPGNPNMYPTIDGWDGIFTLVDLTLKDKYEYIGAMFDRYGDKYTNMIYLCVKSALIDLFDNDPTDDPVVEAASDKDLAILAKLDGIPVTIGSYKLSDYGYMPDNFKEQLSNNVNKDYVVHKCSQKVIVTSIDSSYITPQIVEHLVLKAPENFFQYMIQSVLLGYGDLKYAPGLTVIQTSRDASTILDIYSISLGLNNELKITRSNPFK